MFPERIKDIDTGSLLIVHDLHRIRDDRLIEFASAFNTLAEPIGRSIMTSQLAPYRLGRALLNYAVQVYTREELSLQRRQALEHWKEFLAREPDAPEAEAIEPQVREAQARFLRLQRDRSLVVAHKALDHGDPRLVLRGVDDDLARHRRAESTLGSMRTIYFSGAISAGRDRPCRCAPRSSAGSAASRRYGAGHSQLTAPSAISPASSKEPARSAEMMTGT